MAHVKDRRSIVALGILLAGCIGIPATLSALPTPADPGWSRLTTLAAATPIVVTLDDGRKLERFIVTADIDTLIVVNLDRVQSRTDRDQILTQLRSHPARFLLPAGAREGQSAIDVVERFDRRSILAVARPPSHRVALPKAAGWFLASSGPCPNCDARQTLFGSTVLPSPLPARAGSASNAEVLYAAQPLQAAAMRPSATWPPRLHRAPAAPTSGFALGSPLAAQKQEKKKAEPNVTGKWVMTMEMSMGTATPSLDLKQDGTKITGTYTGRYGTFGLQGTLKDRAIQFSFAMGAEGETQTMTFAGEVAEDGQTMKGTATLGEMGDATWSAKKQI